VGGYVIAKGILRTLTWHGNCARKLSRLVLHCALRLFGLKRHGRDGGRSCMLAVFCFIPRFDEAEPQPRVNVKCASHSTNPKYVTMIQSLLSKYSYPITNKRRPSIMRSRAQVPVRTCPCPKPASRMTSCRVPDPPDFQPARHQRWLPRS